MCLVVQTGGGRDSWKADYNIMRLLYIVDNVCVTAYIVSIWYCRPVSCADLLKYYYLRTALRLSRLSGKCINFKYSSDILFCCKCVDVYLSCHPTPYWKNRKAHVSRPSGFENTRSEGWFTLGGGVLGVVHRLYKEKMGLNVKNHDYHSKLQFRMLSGHAMLNLIMSLSLHSCVA